MAKSVYRSSPHPHRPAGPSSAFPARLLRRPAGLAHPWRTAACLLAFALLLGAAPAEAQDTTAPTLESAERLASDAIVRLAFDENIQLSPHPNTAAFTVTVDGANRSVSSVDTHSSLPRFVHLLLLGSNLTDGHTVRVSYDPSKAGGGSRMLQDLAGNPAAGWNNWLVKTDFTAPALESAAVNGTALTLTWNETVDPEQGESGGPLPAICGLPFATCPTPPNSGNTSSGPPPASAFTVRGIGADQAPSGVSVSGNVVTLTLARGARNSNTVTVSYAKPASNPLRDRQGNAAANVVNRAVTNDTPRVGPLPTRIEATPQDVYLHFGKDIRTGSTATHPMSGDRCPASQAFTLKVDGVPRGSWATRGVEVDGTGGNGLDGWRAKCDARTIHLELWNVPPRAYLIPPGATVTLSYDPNLVSSGPEKGRITYADSTVVPAFTDMAVENNSPYLRWTNVEGSSLLAYFGFELDTGSVPPPSAFTVTVNGTRRNVVANGVSFFGLYNAGVKLTLESPVEFGDTVTLAYDPPSSGALRSRSKGRPVPDFSAQRVTNETPDPNVWSATLMVAIVDFVGHGCDDRAAAQTQKCTSLLDDNNFDHGGVTYRVTQVASVTRTAAEIGINFTLDRAWPTTLRDNATLRLGTTQLSLAHGASFSPDGRTAFLGPISAHLSGSVSLRLTTSGSTSGSGGAFGNFGPSPTSSSVSGTRLKMTFDETLSQGLTPPGGSFKVTSGPRGGAGALGGAFGIGAQTTSGGGAGALGGAFGIGAQATSGSGAVDIPGTGTATVDGAEVTVTLAQAPPAGATLTVAYAPPDDRGSALRGLEGAKVEEFSGEPVTNGGAAAAPVVTGVAAVSDAGDDDTYGLGETIRVAVTFSEAVEVDASGGVPQLTIDMDPADWGEKRAAYESGSGTAELVFAHEVVEPNHSTGGIAVLANSLTANGGTIRSADGTDAQLAHAGLGHDPAHKVDWELAPANGAPEVDTEAAEYDAFTGAGNAPRGVHVSKPFNGIFTDPDGDELTYTVALADPGQAALVELLAIPTEEDLGEHADDVRLAQRVHYRADAEGDWEALDPVPPNPVSVVVTVTATDPDGLSASVDGVFETHWDRTTRPSVTAVAVTSDPGPGDTYRLGDTIRVALTFDEAVEVDAAGGTPSLTIDMDPADWGEKRAAYEGGSGTATLTFAYTVVEPNYSEPGIAVLADSLALNGGTIRSAQTGGDADLSHAGLAHDAAHKVSWQQTRPSATGVSVSSRPAAGDTYRYGETIRVAVAFSEAVEVSGTPRIRIDMDPADWGAKWAAYEGGGGTAELTFAHEVVEPNYSTQGIAVLADTLEANGGAIRSAATAVDAGLSHGGLGHDPAHKVNWLPGLSVADGKAKEGEDAAVEFAVRLGRAATQTVTVDYATADGTAKAGEDYTAASGTLTFSAGESSKTVAVAVLDDAHDEGEETFTLRLSNASGAWLEDAEAVGTIENADLIPAALLARFGRAAAEQVVETVEERLSARRERGFRARLAGREFTPGNEREFALGFLTQFTPGVPLGGGAGGASPATGSHAAGLGSLGAGADTTGTRGTAGGAGMGSGMAGQQALPGGGLFGGDLLSSSGFELNRDSRGGTLSVWSRSARSHFTGMEDALSLNGDVRTTMVGADWARGPLTLGLSVGHSLGLGGYAGARGGQMSTSLTGFYPWVGYEVNDRVSVWGVTGYGKGSLSLTPEGAEALETGVSMAMTAVGTRGELLGPGTAGGLSLAFKADALWVGAASDLLDGPDGRLNASAAGVTRVRTALEGSRGFTLGGGRVSLTPTVELGVRRDGGDAETGAGLDVGGGLAFADTVTGMSLDVRVRTLVVHEAEGFTERGLSLSFGWNPTPSSPLGPSARIAPSWGGAARGGAEALWSGQMAYGMGSPGIYGSAGRLDAEVGYGLPMGARLVGTPSLGLRTSEYGRDYRAGYRVGVLEQGRLQFDLGVEAQRREAAMQVGPSNAFLARATLGW